MVTAIVSINILIALLGFYIAWRVWLIGQALTQVANRLGQWEQQTQQSLQAGEIPVLIRRNRQGTAQLRQQYAHLQGQLQQIRQVIYLVGLVPWLTRSLRSRIRSTGSSGRQERSIRRH